MGFTKRSSYTEICKVRQFLKILGLRIIQSSLEVIYNCKEYSCAYGFLNFYNFETYVCTTEDSLYLDYPSLYLKYFPVSNRNLGPLDIYAALKLFFSPYLKHSLSRISPYLEQVFWSLARFSLSISNYFLLGPFYTTK